MSNIESLLTRWRAAGVLDAPTADRIRTWEGEQTQPAGLRWQGLVALILGAVLLASGVVLFVSAHWDELGPSARLAVVFALVAAFHLAGAYTREPFRGLSTALHAVGTASVGAAIALVGQIFNIQEHWPAAVLLWAISALAGWMLLRDPAQQILVLVLVPAWMVCELEFATEHRIGQAVYLGRLLFAWAVLYLTVFLGSRRKAVQGIMFAAGAIAGLSGIVLMLESWMSSNEQFFVALHVRVWAWIAIAVLPLFFTLFRFSKSVVPVSAAILFSVVLPWCNRTWVEHAQYGNGQSYTRSEPNIFAHVLVAAFCLFLSWWGVRQASKALINLGIVGFAIALVWFYFSDILDKVGRSLGLIGMGILFLAGGWALEKMRRRLIAHMARGKAAQ
jgi:uncharacterized membrane protein